MKKKSIDSVQFEKHEPERRSGVRSYLFCNGGCCCCCCCLHALGGLIGAAVASKKSKSPSEGSVVGCYWICLALLVGAIVIFTLASAQEGGMAIGVIGVLLCLPLVQLLASILTLFWIRIRSTAFPDKRASLLILGKITLYSFLGALVGVIAMIFGFKIFN